MDSKDPESGDPYARQEGNKLWQAETRRRAPSLKKQIENLN